MNATELSERLARDPLAVCRYLYPAGKVDGHEYRLGGTDGSPGKSMGVHLSGDKAGVWCDFATGEGGDLIDLWKAAKGLDLIGALDDIRAYLGVERPNFAKAGMSTPKKKQFKAPENCDKVKIEQGPAMQYLLDRGISEATIRKARVGFRGRQVYFPGWDASGGEKPVLVKYRKIDRNEKGKFEGGPTSKDQKPVLIGWQCVDPNAREVWIVEGEPDWLAGLEMGIPAVLSVPFGGGGKNKQGQWIENEYDNLDRFDTIYLAFDMDEEGELGVQTVIERLGAHRCVRVQLPKPHKDLNDCLLAGATDWKRFPCKQFDPEELKRPSDFRDEIMRALYPGPEEGFPLPWGGFEGDLLWRLAELIVVNGINGHGKSQWLGHVLIDLMSRGHMACIYSGELKPGRLLSRMVRQVNGERAIPKEDRAHTCVDWLDESLLVFDLTGTAKTQRLLEVFEYAYRRYGVQFFAIDSLMKCGIGVDDYNGQKRFVEQLADFKNKFNVTIFLVTHSRKVGDENEMSGKMDVKGDSSITDLPDTVVSVFRNKKKEAEVQPYKDQGLPIPPDVADKYDAMIHVLKQRNGEWEGKQALYFDRFSLQYTDEREEPLFDYLPGGAR